MAEVYLTRRALLDIEEIDLYSVAKWGDDVVTQYLVDLYAGAERLGESPKLLAKRPGTSLRLRFYRVREHVFVCDVIGGDIFVPALRAAVLDLSRRIAGLEPQLVHEAELLARRIERGSSEGGASYRPPTVSVSATRGGLLLTRKQGSPPEHFPRSILVVAVLPRQQQSLPM